MLFNSPIGKSMISDFAQCPRTSSVSRSPSSYFPNSQAQGAGKAAAGHKVEFMLERSMKEVQKRTIDNLQKMHNSLIRVRPISCRLAMKAEKSSRRAKPSSGDKRWRLGRGGRNMSAQAASVRNFANSSQTAFSLASDSTERGGGMAIFVLTAAREPQQIDSVRNSPILRARLRYLRHRTATTLLGLSVKAKNIDRADNGRDTQHFGADKWPAPFEHGGPCHSDLISRLVCETSQVKWNTDYFPGGAFSGIAIRSRLYTQRPRNFAMHLSPPNNTSRAFSPPLPSPSLSLARSLSLPLCAAQAVTKFRREVKLIPRWPREGVRAALSADFGANLPRAEGPHAAAGGTSARHPKSSFLQHSR